MRTNHDDLIAELRGTFDALTSTIPDQPPTTWDDVLKTTGNFELAQVITLHTPESAASIEAGAPPRSRFSQLTHPARPRKAVVLGLVAACLVLAGIVIPLATQRGPEAAAAILRATAMRVSEHGVLSPTPGQALQDTYNVAIEATQNGESGSASSSATFDGTVEEWTTSLGTGQEQIAYGSPQFASAADAQTWVYGKHFPFEGTIPYNTAGPVIALGPAIGAFDVSSLPTSEAPLASLLGQSTTGVKGLDQIQGGPDVVYNRIALLLSTPLLGSSPQLESAIYQVLANVPGIETLGTTTDHSGRTGTGFTEPGSAFTLIIDTNTGALLELLEHPNAATFPTSGGSSEGTETLLWLDPSGEQLIPASAIPATTAP
jgi:hypothetical protein